MQDPFNLDLAVSQGHKGFVMRELGVRREAGSFKGSTSCQMPLKI